MEHSYATDLWRGLTDPFLENRLWAQGLCALNVPPPKLQDTLPVLGVEGAEHLFEQVGLVAITQLPAPCTV